jgi:guanine deaminase
MNMSSFFEIACHEAEQGMLAGEGGPFGAVVVKNGKVIGRGHNRVLYSNDSTAHAEIVAIRQAEQTNGTHELSGSEIYTTCFPCPMCLGAILWARISRVYYGSKSEEAAAAGFDDMNFYKAVSNPNTDNLFIRLEYHDSPDCRSLFKKWLGLENRKMY